MNLPNTLSICKYCYQYFLTKRKQYFPCHKKNCHFAEILLFNLGNLGAQFVQPKVICPIPVHLVQTFWTPGFQVSGQSLPGSAVSIRRGRRRKRGQSAVAREHRINLSKRSLYSCLKLITARLMLWFSSPPSP